MRENTDSGEAFDGRSVRRERKENGDTDSGVDFDGQVRKEREERERRYGPERRLRQLGL